MLFRKKKKQSIIKLKKSLNENNIPKHVAIVLDGNGRWANKRGAPRTYGHKVGAKNLLTIAKIAKNIGILNLTVYAFSTENWKRPKDEVKYLLEAPIKFFDENIDIFIKSEIKVVFLGELNSLSEELQKKCQEVEKITKDYEFVLAIALNYGGKAEIIHSVKEIVKQSSSLEDISEENIDKNLYTKDLYPLDMLIRPGGERRLSNFLIWQSAYTEFYFTNVLWPDFNEYELLLSIQYFQSRNRRYGGLNNGGETK